MSSFWQAGSMAPNFWPTASVNNDSTIPPNLESVIAGSSNSDSIMMVPNLHSNMSSSLRVASSSSISTTEKSIVPSNLESTISHGVMQTFSSNIMPSVGLSVKSNLESPGTSNENYKVEMPFKTSVEVGFRALKNKKDQIKLCGICHNKVRLNIMYKNNCKK